MNKQRQPQCITAIRLPYDDSANEIAFPVGGQIVGVHPSNVESSPFPVLLVLADRHAATEPRGFIVTKYAVPESQGELKYVGSCADPAQPGFCHVFEVVAKPAAIERAAA
jgi:hypothetical protein